MQIIDELQTEMKALSLSASHRGYFYSINDALIMLICGLLCGLREIDEIHQWIMSEPTQKMLHKEFWINRYPSRSQFYNLLKLVDPEKFKHSFIRWIQSVFGQPTANKVVSIDGKTIRGTDKLTKDGTILNVVSAYVSELKLVIGSHECTDKPGERQAFRELLELIDVKDAIVVADALHCTQKTANAVTEAGADYLFTVKNNVPSLKSQIENHIQSAIQSEKIQSSATEERNGGRIEKRTAYAETNIDWLRGKEKWAKIATIGAIHREFEKGGKISSEWHYYISSATLDSTQLLNNVRLEWGVESMHWLLDVHYAEDKTRVWDMNVQRLLNTARKIALNLLHVYKSADNKHKTPLSRIMRNNLFDLRNFASFMGVLRRLDKLD